MVQKISKMKDAELNRFMVEIAMTPNLDGDSHHYTRKGDRLSDLATRYKINVQKIRAEIAKYGAGKKQLPKPSKKGKVKTGRRGEGGIIKR